MPVFDYAVVRVFFATDRNVTGNELPAKKFGAERSQLAYGSTTISIPRDHKLGVTETPSIWKLEFRENPDKHVILQSAVIQPKDEFFSAIAERVHSSADGSAFVFVHGYNVTFEDAAKRTAQISYDLGFDGAPVFYSWPSEGKTAAYTIDEGNVEWAQSNLKNFLEDFFVRSDAKNVYLIAHSMGSRALTRAVSSLMAERKDFQPRLKEIILAAPDIDAAVFKKDIAPALKAAGRPITLYVSSKDIALIASKKVHRYPRAGESGRGLVVVPGIETVDATGVDTGFLGHSYFADTRTVLSDMSTLFKTGQRAGQRFGLRDAGTHNNRYWSFKK